MGGLRYLVSSAEDPETAVAGTSEGVNLPDERLNVLAGISGMECMVPTPVSFVDSPGVVRDASEGEGLDY